MVNIHQVYHLINFPQGNTMNHHWSPLNIIPCNYSPFKTTNVGKTNHKPSPKSPFFKVIWLPFSVMGGLWHCFTHINHYEHWLITINQHWPFPVMPGLSHHKGKKHYYSPTQRSRSIAPRGNTHAVEKVVALTVAVRGAEQIKDNSPKQSPLPWRILGEVEPR